MSWQKGKKIIEIIIIALGFCLVNRRVLIIYELYPSIDIPFSYGSVWTDIILWFPILTLCFLILWSENLQQKFIRKWIKNWPLIIFIGYSTISLFWTVDLSVSLCRLIILSFSSIIATYIGVRYKIHEFIVILAWLGAVIVVLNFLLIAFMPKLGIMLGYPYFGAWRGIFWHRNHLGILEALFNFIFLIMLVNRASSRKIHLIINAVFYTLTMLLVILSRSATGVILLIAVNIITLAAIAWLKWGTRLYPIHYYGLAIVSVTMMILLFINIDFFFGLFGRNTTLTGRVPLWVYLLENVVKYRPIFGYGYGAIWNNEAFRISTAKTLGWGYQVLIADNGYLDILLNLGIVGLLSFLSVVVLAIIRGIKYFQYQRLINRLFPVLILVFILVANISYSLFLELESFIWLIMLAVLFITTPIENKFLGVDSNTTFRSEVHF